MLKVLRKFCFVFPVFISVGLPAQKFFDEAALIRNLRILSTDSMQGRRTAMPGNLMAAKYILSQFKKSGINPLNDEYEVPFQFQSRGETQSGVNLVGVIPGAVISDQYIVISAHYDHVGARGENIYNGADDNASGVGALLAISEYLRKNPPRHNVIIVAFDAEELGLQGAKAFVQNPPVELKKIVLNINMDMVARADQNELIACGTSYNPHLKPLIDNIKPEGKVKIMFGHDNPQIFTGKENWTFSSDHGPFHKAKIPFIYFGVADHADYHQPGDDFEKVNPETYINCVKLIIRAFIEIDNGLK